MHKFLIAGYGLPAEYVLATLFSLGITPNNIAILTHKSDARNIGLISSAQLREIDICQMPAKSIEAYNFVKEFDPDIILSIHFRELIPQQIIDCSDYGGINLHPSLLPDYKGANSIPWALINGEEKIGFTYHLISDEFDKGNIIFQESFKVSEEDTSFSLFHKSIVLSMNKFEHVLSMVFQGCKGIPQEKAGRYFSRKLPFDGKIDPSWNNKKIARFIRAMYFPPFPNASVDLNGSTYFVSSFGAYEALLNDSYR